MNTARSNQAKNTAMPDNAPGLLLMAFDKLMHDVAALAQEDNKQHNELSTLKLGSDYPKYAVDITYETLILIRPMMQNIDDAIKNIDTNSAAGKLQLALKTKKIKTELDLILEHLKKLNSLDPKKPLVYKKFNVEQFPLPHIVDHKTLALSDAVENFLYALNLRIAHKSINRLHLRRLKHLNDCVKIMTNDDNRLSTLSEQIFQKISMTIDQDSPLGKIRSKACREQVKNINTVIALPKDPDYRKILDDKFKALNDIILIEQSPEKARAKLDAILGYNEKFAELDLEKLSTLENNFTALEEEIAQLKIKKDAQKNASFLNRITTYFFYSPQQSPVSALETAEYNYEVYKKYLKDFHALQQSIEKTYITPLNDLCSKLEFEYTKLNKKSDSVSSQSQHNQNTDNSTFLEEQHLQLCKEAVETKNMVRIIQETIKNIRDDYRKNLEKPSISRGNFDYNKEKMTAQKSALSHIKALSKKKGLSASVADYLEKLWLNLKLNFSKLFKLSDNTTNHHTFFANHAAERIARKKVLATTLKKLHSPDSAPFYYRYLPTPAI